MHHQDKSSMEAFKQKLEQQQQQLLASLDEAQKTISDMPENLLRSSHGQTLEAIADNLDTAQSWLKETIAELSQAISEVK